MKELCMSLAILAVAALTASAAPGDQWILGIHHIDKQGDKPFTTYVARDTQGRNRRATRNTLETPTAMQVPAPSASIACIGNLAAIL